MKTYNNGGEQACKNNLNLLQQIFGEENVFSLFFTEHQGELPDRYFAFNRLRRLKGLVAQFFGCKMYYPWQEKNILYFIKNLNPDIIFFDSIITGNLVKKIPANVLKIVFEHNCEKKYYALKVKHEGIIFWPEYLAICRNEKSAIKNCDVLICINKRDSNDIYRYYDRKADVILPIFFKNRFIINKLENGSYNNELLFIGSNFGPNYEGIKWFIDNVMIKLSDFKLYVVGKNFEDKKLELERDNVKIIGTVENLEEYYYKYPIIVMPIFYGSGMKVKTAEAMMYGKTILATDEALEGYEVSGVKGIIRCNTAEEFINSILSICSGNLKYFQKEVYQLYCDKYSEEAATKTLKKLFEQYN